MNKSQYIDDTDFKSPLASITSKNRIEKINIGRFGFTSRPTRKSDKVPTCKCGQAITNTRNGRYCVTCVEERARRREFNRLHPKCTRCVTRCALSEYNKFKTVCDTCADDNTEKPEYVCYKCGCDDRSSFGMKRRFVCNGCHKSSKNSLKKYDGRDRKKIDRFPKLWNDALKSLAR